MLHRLANSLGFQNALRHIETVVPSGAELQANPEMAIECLKTACQNASLNGVKSIILGGAGLAGYAAQIQSMVDLPIIDSATAGLEVTLQQLAPKANVANNGTYAVWKNMPNIFEALPSR
jgi:Asp/Glu/hydantoin racemase